ncbi:hypothetical protein BDV37DRAFT_253747 [Aspergillus pseudonomiae]|uniref:C2H2-type domain-containing protein n=1 Tax=Aspergillus pseudonomiae TaxID=1506151 RepID=A0A5N7D6C2_9EURO|nr:uncharacterized protein BDV37DRAFT_253747 [Aspergillus pseudonomiae]KAE8401839.1 hypothetical protein BDV37DRAFT_253747 [Aspergillus pseudonomiae]
MAWFPADPNWDRFYLLPGIEQELDLESILRDIPQPASQQHAMPSYPQRDLPTVDATSPDPHLTLIARSTNDNPGLSNQATISRNSPFHQATEIMVPYAEQSSEQLGHPGATPSASRTRTPRRPLQRQGNRTTPFRCGWKDCTYNGTFGRKAELMRHIDLLHVSPHSFDCPLRGCKRVFNRWDNLSDHMRRAHHIQG